MNILPKVSIFLTTYNHVNYIETCISSCLNQTYQNIEICVSDDCSSDGTPEILTAYALKFPNKIRLNLNHENLGLKYNAPKALSMCSGEYICGFSGDDIMHPSKIERQVIEFLKNKSLVLCGHGINYIDAAGDFIYESRPSIKEGVGILEWLKSGVKTHAVSIMVKADRVPSFGFDLRLNSGEKKFFIDVIGQEGEFLFLNEALVDYRRHGNNLSKDYRTIEDSIIFLRILEEEFKFIPIGYINEVKSNIFFSEFAHFLKRKNYKKSLTKVINCFLYSPKVFIQRIFPLLGGKGLN
jgi:glycosyltransferase involved in cell wall biosynthesis